MFEVYSISAYAQLAGSIIISVSCLLLFKKRPAYIKALGYYAMVSVLFSLMQEISHINSLSLTKFIGNGFVFSEAVFLGAMYFFATENGRFKSFAVKSVMLYIIFYLITFLFYADSSYSLVRFGRDSIMISFAVGYFYYLIRKLPEENLLRFPMFWINSAVIFFFSGTFVLSLMVDYMASMLHNDTAGFWAFRNFFRLAFCLVLSYAGLLNLRQIKLKE